MLGEPISHRFIIECVSKRARNWVMQLPGHSCSTHCCCLPHIEPHIYLARRRHHIHRCYTAMAKSTESSALRLRI
jgi:hypothetical protein